MNPIFEQLKCEAAEPVSISDGEHFTVVALIRNGVIPSDGSFIGKTYLCLKNSNGVITASEWNEYRKQYGYFCYMKFVHGINAVLRKIEKPMTHEEIVSIYKSVKESGAQWHNIQPIKL